MSDSDAEISEDVKNEVNTIITHLVRLNSILALKIKSLEGLKGAGEDETKKPSKLKKNGLRIESGLHRYFKGSIEYEMFQLLTRSIKKQNWRFFNLFLDPLETVVLLYLTLISISVPLSIWFKGN